MPDAAIASMTGFASRRGAGAGHLWVWDIRSVNGKGLDLRLRLPEGLDRLEPVLRSVAAQRLARGNVSVTLKLEGDVAAAPFVLSQPGLAAALAALAAIERAAERAGLVMATASAAEVLGLRGVTEAATPDEVDTAPLIAALRADFEALLAEMNAMRHGEGAAMVAVLAGQLARVSGLTEAARSAAEARRPQVAAALKDNLARVMAGAAEADPARVAQELALLAVKADVTEELDRLGAHVAAARALLAEGGVVGRKLEFLMQEFLREANTLCSKSGSGELTRIGLDLKHVIDQMREQALNLE